VSVALLLQRDSASYIIETGDLRCVIMQIEKS